MNLQKQIDLIIALFIILSLALLALIFYVYNANHEMNRDLEIISALHFKIGELQTVGFEYALYREERPRIQVNIVMQALPPLFERLRISSIFQTGASLMLWQDSLSRFNECQRYLSLFVQQTPTQLQQERERQMVSLFLLRSAALATAVDGLIKPLREHEQQVNYLIFLMISITTLIFLGLPMVNFFLLRWSVLRPLNILMQTINEINTGNLSLRLHNQDLNEFGQLARAFDQMLDHIHTQEEQLHAILNNADTVIFIKDTAGHYLLVNRRYEELFHISTVEIRGKTDFDIFPKDVAETFQANDKKILESMISQKIEERVPHDDGLHIYISVKFLLYDDSGKPYGVCSIATDITERKKMEDKLRAAALYNRSLIEASLDPLVTISVDGKITDVNKATEFITGILRENLIGSDFFDYFTEPDKARAGYRQVFSEGFVFDYPLAIRHTSGSITDVLYNATIYQNEDDEVQGVFAAARDITERKFFEETLIKSRASLRAILDNVPYLIWQKDINGHFVSVNKAFFLSTECESIQKMLGKTDFEILPQALAEKCRVEDNEVMATRQQKLIEQMITTKNGDIRWLEIYKAPILDENGQMLGTTGFAKDITDYKQYVEGLHTAQKLAEEISVAKSNFLANMSHEIRTPMSAIIGLSELALYQPLSQEVRGYLENICLSSKSLLGILNDILDYSKIESGRMTIEHAPFNLDILLSTLHNLFALRAKEKVLNFVIEVAPETPKQLVGDILRLQQVLSNLLGNAMKFTESGRVSLQIASQAIENSQAKFVFKVEDTGIGMSEETIAHLFQSFTQADGSISRRFGGTGLGLAISRELLLLMGSDFTVTSVFGQGSIFIFELSLGVSMETQININNRTMQMSIETHKLAGVRILVAEDNTINQQIIRVLLQRWGMVVAIANHGQEALEYLATNHFDVVLMDVHMPQMDGLTATRKIRQIETLATLPIIALTAGVTSEERELVLASGMNDFIGKPINQEELAKTLLQWVHVPTEVVPTRSENKTENSKDAKGNPAALTVLVDQLQTLLAEMDLIPDKLMTELRMAIPSELRTVYKIFQHHVDHFDYKQARIVLKKFIG